LREEDLETHLGLPNTQDATLGILRENGESFHNSRFNFIQKVITKGRERGIYDPTPPSTWPKSCKTG